MIQSINNAGGGGGSSSAGGLTTVLQTGTVTVTSSIVFVNTDLKWTAVAGKTYKISAFLRFTNNTTGGMRLQIQTADTTAVAQLEYGYNAATTYSPATLGNYFFNGMPAAMINSNAFNNHVVRIEGTVTAVNGGDFTIQFAQQTSNGTSTVLELPSYLQYQQID